MSIRLGPFELVAPLGQGGMGVVWQGVHRAQDVQVAVKVITEKIARDEGYLKAFRNEVASVARLDHPGIVWLYDYGQVSRRAARDSYGQLVEGSPYLAMELADAGTLSGSSGSGGYQVDGWPELHDIVVQLLDALAHAHARGVIHRDLKPANVLRCSPTTPGGRARILLTDFGIAHALDATETATHDGVMGTLQYMSPEQIKAEWRDYGPWTDLYALGNLIWKLATGQLPFAGLTHADLLAAQLHREPPPFRARFDVPRELATWLRTLLAKLPRQRFQCAADAAAALRSLAAPASDDARSRPRTTTTIVPAADSDDWLDEPTETHSVDDVGPLGPPRPARPPSDWRGFPNPSIGAAPLGRGHALLGVGRGLFGVRTIPLVGRIAERDRLWRELWAVHDTGESRVAVLRGDAGVGKTRLAGWLAERAHEVGAASVIHGRCSPTQAPELALRDALLRWMHAARLDPQTRRARVETVLAGNGVRSPALVDRVSELCEPVAPIDGESRHEEIVGLLTALGAWRPVLLVVDDAQWGMDAIRLALRILEAQGCRALVVLCVSDELLADRTVEVGLLEEVVADPRVAEIRVGPLEDEQRMALVEGVLGLNPELARRVAGRSRGNPLFAVQLIATLVVHDLLLPGAEGFDIRKPSATAPLEIRRAADFPANLGQLWRERLERLFEDLPDGAQAALERAAALGVEVDRDLWQQVCDDPDGAYAAGDRVLFVPGNAKIRHQIVLRLVAERLAEETQSGWNFAHAPVRDLLERISRDAGRYAEHHLACATGIRRTWDPSTSEAVGLHLLAGGATDQGIGMLLAATRHRALSVGFRAALGLLETVETALIDAGIPKSDPRWAAVWLARSALYTRLADPDEALRWARRAEASARAFGWPDQAGNAAIHAGIALCGADRPDEAVVELARGLAEAGEADPRVSALGRAWLANAYARSGRLGPAAAALAEAEQRLAGEAETGLALAWDEYARASRASGNIVAAREGWTRAAGHWRALGNRIALRVSDAAARIAGG